MTDISDGYLVRFFQNVSVGRVSFKIVQEIWSTDRQLIGEAGRSHE